jgi:flagellar motility protein MotE (MotC chaperone)
LISIAVIGLTYVKLIHLPWLEESFVFKFLPGTEAVAPNPEVADTPVELPRDEEGNLLPVDPLLQELLDKYQLLEAEKETLQQENDRLTGGAGELQEEMTVKEALLAEWGVKEQAWLESETLYQQQIDLLNQQMIQQDEQANGQAQEERKQVYGNLAAYYIQMNTQKAADIMANLTNDELIGVLERMDEETAAAIIERLPKEKAVSISKQMLIVSP